VKRVNPMGERFLAGYEPPKHELDDTWHVPTRILRFSSSDAEALCPAVYTKGEHLSICGHG